MRKELAELIISVPDYPSKGVSFKDITPLLADGIAFKEAVKKMAAFAKSLSPDVIIAAEARGFVCGAALANELGCGLILARKPNKLPRASITEESTMEYGKSTLAIHEDSLAKGQRVLVVDDLLATGGTASVCSDLSVRLGAEVVGYAFLVAIKDMGGRQRLMPGKPVFCCVEF